MAQFSSRGTQLFCSLFIVLGIIAIGAGVWMMIGSLRSEQWPVTDGIILSAEMKSHSGEHGNTYSAEVAYDYQVGGVGYTGRKISIGQMSSSTGYAQGILNRYPVGKKVSVHYSPADPEEAVLETGIHGGTWICLGLGLVFTLVGAMFLQISRAAARAQMPGATPSSLHGQPDGSVTMDQPPVLMGVIFLLAGIGLSFVTPDNGTPRWIVWAVGAMFASGGLLLLLYRLENKIYHKLAMVPMLLAFLAVFHWVSFGADVRWPFAIFTILVDVIIVAGVIHALMKRWRDRY